MPNMWGVLSGSKQALSVVCLMLVLMSCQKDLSQKNDHPGDSIVATIGTYHLYVSDYKREMKKLTHSEKKALATEAGREAFLEQLIDQQVLLKEAELQDIDKEYEFRLFVEQFWKQAMIERLFIRKTREVMEHLSVTDEELVQYYDEMQRMVKARIRVVGTEKVARKLLEETMLTYEEELLVQKDSGWHWFVYEEVESAYRNFLFAMEDGGRKVIYNYDLGWVYFELEESKARDDLSPELLQEKLVEVLHEERDLEVLERWIRQLRAQTNVHVNKDVLHNVKV